MKTTSLKSPKIDIFQKRLTHGFGPKMAIFPTLCFRQYRPGKCLKKLFVLGNVGHQNVFYDILERQNAFLGYKKRSLKSPKIDIFPKELTHGFGPKMAIF